MDMKEAIKKLCEDKSFNEALNLCEQAMSEEPTPWLHLCKGELLLDLGHPHEALKAYENAIDLDQNNADAWNGKGHAYDTLGLHEMALDAYDKAIKLDPNNAGILHNKGNSLYFLGWHEKALNAYEQAISLDNTLFAAWNGKGNTLHLLGRQNEALQSYERALNLNSEFAFAWNGKGNVLNSYGHYEEALISFDKAIKLDATFSHPWNGKSITYYHQGKHSLTARCRKRFCALATPEEIINLHVNILELFSYYEHGPFFLKRIAEKHPLLLTSSQWIEAYRGALDDCRAALILRAFLDSPLNNQEEMELLLVKGLLNYLYGDAEIADQIFTSLVKSDPADLLAHYYLLQARSDYFEPTDLAEVKALETAKAALDDDQAEVQNLYYAGLVLSLLGQEDIAREAFTKADGFLPAMYQRAILLDDLTADGDTPACAKKVIEDERDSCIQAILEQERTNVRFGRPLLAGNPMARIDFMADSSWPSKVVEFAHAHEISGAANLLEDFFERHPEEDYGLANKEAPSIPWATTLEEAECGLQLASDSQKHFECEFARDIQENMKQTRGILADEGFPVAAWEALTVHDLEEALAERLEQHAQEAGTEERLMGLVGYFMCSGKLPVPIGLLLRFYLAALCSKDGSAENIFLRILSGIAGGFIGELLGGKYGVFAGPVATEVARSLFEFYKKHPHKPKSYHEFKTHFLKFARELDLSADLWS